MSKHLDNVENWNYNICKLNQYKFYMKEQFDKYKLFNQGVRKISIKDIFKEALKDTENSELDIIEKFIIFGTPYIFRNNEETYFELKKDVANFFGNSIKDVIMVGSAKLGFSIAPQNKFRDIQDDSDIDIVIISDDIFDYYWVKLFEFNINLISRTEKEDDMYKKFLKYFFKGWLRPDYFPFNFKGKDDWFDFFSSISYNKYDKRKVTGAVFKNEYFFKKYHENNIKALREVIINE